MSWIEASVRRPTSVAVAVLLASIFGAIALQKTPVQLKPTVDRPEISVEVEYPGAAPLEVEQQITDPYEQALQTVEGLREMRSTSSQGQSTISLEFDWGVDKDLALIDVLKKIARLPDEIPDNARDPEVTAVSSDEDQPVVWSYLYYEDPQATPDFVELTYIAEEIVKPRIERLEGVGRVRVRGALRRELRVVIDPVQLAKLQLTVQDVEQALRRENRNVPAGRREDGRQAEDVRTVGQFASIEDVRQTFLAERAGRRVVIGDVAQIQRAFERPDSAARIDGKDGLSISYFRKTGENVLDVVKRIDAKLAELNDELRPRGITLRKAYDEAQYVYAALENVTQNLIVGALLAAAVLIFFLRSTSAVLAVGITIPISVVASFILFYLMGRTINVISLAGVTFASGMVVDNAIIVFENIYRLRREGHAVLDAVLRGTHEVYGAVLASTLTTLAVFLPIFFVEEESGQLFKDIAIAIALAVGLSMIAALTVIPCLCARLWKQPIAVSAERNGGLVDWLLLGPLGRAGAHAIVALHAQMQRNTWTRLATALLLSGAAMAAWKLLPSAEYLPAGNRPMIFGNLRFPPGTSLARTREVMHVLEERLADLPDRRYFFVSVSPGRGFCGIALEPRAGDRVDAMVDEVRRRVGVIPDVRIFFAKSNIFTRGIGGAKDLKLYVSDTSLERLQETSSRLERRLAAVPGVLQALSSFELGNPERQIAVDREAASKVGLGAESIGAFVETLVSGRRAGRYRGHEFPDEVELRVIGDESFRDGGAELSRVPLWTPAGTQVALGSVARFAPSFGPSRIEHVERKRAVTIDVKIANDAVLEDAIETIERDVLTPERAALPVGAGLRLAGSVDDLTRTREALVGSFALAVAITYLLMVALFESFLFPLLVMFSVPLATAGAVLGIRWVGAEFNVMTMLGFILLCGIVVNNAILLVDRALVGVRAGEAPQTAIALAVRLRLRPIFMSMITTCLGMAPLIFVRGAGTELYRGLGAAVFFGLLFSTVLTLFLIPALLGLLLPWMKLGPRAIEVPEELAPVEVQPS
jgi:HAE1 family hydrophobic/amphiphilic exporter-1